MEEKMSKALVVIDWQKEWANPTSEYYLGTDLLQETEKLNKLIEFARQNSFKIVFVKHHEKTGDAFQDLGGGTDLVRNLDTRETDVIVDKFTIGAFYQTNLEKTLTDANEVIVCGILTNLCVRSFVSDAYDRGFKIKLVADSSYSFDPETQDFTLRDLKTTRPEIEIVNIKDLI